MSLITHLVKLLKLWLEQLTPLFQNCIDRSCFAVHMSNLTQGRRAWHSYRRDATFRILDESCVYKWRLEGKAEWRTATLKQTERSVERRDSQTYNPMTR